MIEISHKISLITDEKITIYFNSEWKSFINEKVCSWLNLFNRKLCYEEKTPNIFISTLDNKLEEPSSGSEKKDEFTSEEKIDNVNYNKISLSE